MDALQTKIECYIKKNLTQKRLEHTYSVCDTALLLNKSNNFNISEKSIIYASYLHDASRYYKLEEMKSILDENNIAYKSHYNEGLLHAKVSMIIAKNDFCIEDADIINAILYHTTGRAEMSMLEKIIYASDYLEPLRKLDKADEIRSIAIKDFNKALLLTIIESISFVLSQKQYLDTDSILMYNHNMGYCQN